MRKSELNIGDWSNGMIGVSKTFGGGSIPSSPGGKSIRNAENKAFLVLFYFLLILFDIFCVFIKIFENKKSSVKTEL